MSKIRSKDTRPELVVRSMLHRIGLRFRLHRKDLPGCPDIVLPKYKVVILVHGCFWHQHVACNSARIPTTNYDKWKHKLDGNVQRDAKIVDKLNSLGWRVLIIWECEVRKDMAAIEKMIINYIHNKEHN